MANNVREQYLQLRHGTRDILASMGVPSNPMVSDNWIVNAFREKARLSYLNENEQDTDFTTEHSFDLFLSSLINCLAEIGVQIQGKNDSIESVLKAFKKNRTFFPKK